LSMSLKIWGSALLSLRLIDNNAAVPYSESGNKLLKLMTAISRHCLIVGPWLALSRSRKPALGLTFVVFAMAAGIRLWAAPLSAGVDVPQFWAFARVFLDHGLDFYRYADASLDTFPVPGWRFVYPPVWLLTLGLSLWASPGSSATNEAVSISWRLAEKAPIMAADIIIGVLIYRTVRGSRWKKLLFSSIWLFNPAAWYQSSVFGQFDAIAAGLLLASVLAFERDKFKLAFILAGLALMTKQYMLLPVVVILAVYARDLGKRKAVSGSALLAGTAAVISVPFLVFGDVFSYAVSVFAPGQGFDYDNPLMYIFSGSKALSEYLRTTLGWDTVNYLALTLPLLAISVLIAAWTSYRKSVTFLNGALVGLLLFIALSYQVNYQYIIAFIPLAVLAASRVKGWDRVLTLALGLMPAAWLWLFDTSIWFTSYEPSNRWVTPLLARVGLVRYVPDYYYVIFAVTLMVLCLAYALHILISAKPRGKDGPGLPNGPGM